MNLRECSAAQNINQGPNCARSIAGADVGIRNDDYCYVTTEVSITVENTIA